MKDTMADRDACCELIYRFYRHLDKREPEALDACMARDGTYLRPSGKVLPAGAELIADLKRSPPTAFFRSITLESRSVSSLTGSEGTA